MTSPWWLIKVLAGLALVVWSVLSALGHSPLSPLLRLPVPAGQALVIAGAGLHLWHYALLKRRAGPLDLPGHLVTNAGLFRRVRHPMYLGDAIAYTGLFALSGDAIALALLLAGLWALVQQCRLEDRELRTHFGAAFDAWAQRTRMLVPGVL